MHRVPTRLSSLVVVTLLAASLGYAQPRVDGTTSHVEAFVRMRQAATAQARGDLPDATRLLREAITLGAPPAALRELALVLEAQNLWRDAAGAWTRYGGLASTEADRVAAIQRREALRRMLTALRVRVQPPVAARVARVWFDHDPPRWYAAGGIEQVAEGGRHRVRVEAEGFEPWEMMIPTSFGDPVQVVAVMLRSRTIDAGAAH